MATQQQLETALRNAAVRAREGDPRAQEAARRFATELKAMRAAPAAPVQSPAADSRTATQETGRQSGLGLRHVIEGTAQTAGIVYDPLAVIGNNILPGDPFMSAASLGDYTADKMGLPEPENGYERVAGGVARGVTGAGGFLGLGKGIAGPIGASLSAKPVAQMTAGGLGGGAAQTAQEAGLPPYMQVLAGLGGALAPSAGSGLLKLAGRGAEQGRQTLASNIDTYAQAGAGTPTLGQGSEVGRMRGLEALLGRAPGSVGVVARAGEGQQAGMGARTASIADRLSTRASPEQAGRAIERGISGPGGFVAATRDTLGKLYDKLDAYIAPDRPVAVTATTGALGKLNAPIPGAPNVSKLFENGRIKGIESALGKDLEAPTGAQNALAKAMADLDALYTSRNSATQAGGQLDALANQQANAANRFYPVQGMPRVPGSVSGLPERANAASAAAAEARNIARERVQQAGALEGTIESLRAAVTATGGRLPYEAIKKLRTLVGEEIDNAGLMADVPRSKWRSLYGALSDDMRKAAEEAGPEAVAAWQRANLYSRVRIERLEAVERVIDKNGGPENVYKAVMSATNEGATTLRAVMQSLPQDARQTMAAAVIRRMGRAKPGKQDETGEAFSSETFLTNWNSLSKEAKAALFNRVPGYLQNLEAIARAASGIRDGAKALSNPSGTSGAAAQMGASVALATTIATGQHGAAAMLAGGMLTANGLARALSNPRFVNWMAQQTRTPVAALPIQIARLKAEAVAEGDEETLELIREMESAKQASQ